MNLFEIEPKMIELILRLNFDDLRKEKHVLWFRMDDGLTLWVIRRIDGRARWWMLTVDDFEGMMRELV